MIFCNVAIVKPPVFVSYSGNLFVNK